jgi:hypothetical protein
MRHPFRWSTCALSLLCAALATLAACNRHSGVSPRTFATPEDAVRELMKAVKDNSLDGVAAIFGPDSQPLIASADPATARRNRQVFAVAARERWHLEDHPDGSKLLIIGNENWPFPVPLVKDGAHWRFDTAAGMDEVLTRRIGRNELAVIRICRTYVAAQRLYAERGHDDQPAGVFAAAFKSDPGRHNGLYWPSGRGEKRSPLGDLVAAAAADGRPIGTGGPEPSPFYGYYFKILTAQGPSAHGGARDYVTNGRMTGGFALMAWPAQYDATGIMTFIVNHEGVVHEKNLGPGTEAASAITSYDPDPSWRAVP